MDSLIEVFANYYGIKYKDVIASKLNDCLFIFNSNPVDNYLYNLNHEVKFKDKIISKIDFENYNIIYKIIRNKYVDMFINDISSDFNVSKSVLKDLFINNKIDIFLPYYDELLKSSPTQVNKNIISQREDVRKFIDIEKIDLKKYIELRSKYQNKFKEEICARLKFISNIDDKIYNKFKVYLPFSKLYDIAFTKDPFFMNAIADDVKINIIRFPIKTIVNRLNENNYNESVDVLLLHEIIHLLENTGLSTGINYIDKNKIINEIRTQKLAIKLTSKLHESGTLLFDKKCYDVLGISDYEAFFFLCDDVINKYERVFSEVAINNLASEMDILFNENFKAFSLFLDKLYDDYMGYKNVTDEGFTLKIDESIKDIISGIELDKSVARKLHL